MNSLANRQRGVTLVELLVSIVIVSIAIGGILGVLSMTTAASADPMIRHQAAAIAEAYLEEIMLKPFSDPDGLDGEGARADFDDLDDYDGLVDLGARNQFGTAIAALASYNVGVSVSPSSGFAGIPAADALRVDVVVTHPNDINFVLSGYRTRL
jgi:MSHA pilin protein MshD